MMLVLAAFDITELSLGSITLTTAGKSDITVALSAMTAQTGDGERITGLWTHYDIGLGQTQGQDLDETVTCGDLFPVSAFDDALTALLQTAATSASWTTPSSLGVVYIKVANRYAFTYGAATFTLEFTAAAGATLLGFSSLTYTAAASHGGEQAPNYTIECSLEQVSAVGGEDAKNYEADTIATQSVASGGQLFGLARMGELTISRGI